MIITTESGERIEVVRSARRAHALLQIRPMRFAAAFLTVDDLRELAAQCEALAEELEALALAELSTDQARAGVAKLAEATTNVRQLREGAD